MPGDGVLTDTAAGGFSHTDTWLVLSLVKGARAQSLQRSRRVMPARRAIRSSSDGQT
jgi:hypothetical protein